MARLQGLLRLGRSRRTETALLVSFVVLGIVLGFGAGRSIDKVTDYIAVSERGRYYGAVVDDLQMALGDVLRAESEQRGYLVTGDTSLLTTYDDSVVAARRRMERLLELTAGEPALSAQVAEVKAISEKRFEHLEAALDLHRTGRERQADESVKAARPLSISMRTRFAQVQSQYEDALALFREQGNGLRRDAIRSFAVTSALAAVVLGLMAVMVILEARFIRALSERLLHASRHDELTALPNRAYLNEWLEHAIAAAKRSGERLALLYLDLNGFKQVNDNLGHAAGDEVLAEVGRRLRAIARDADFVARLGGDEFAVVMPRVADRAQIDAAAERFAVLEIRKGPHAVGASVGCALYPDDADTAQSLMQVSDAGMYERKQRRRRG
jgi:diguanylate cyclase (GGDEF)-like protein